MRVVVLGKGLMLANVVLGAIDAGADVVGAFRYESVCTPKWKLLLQEFFNPSSEVTLLKKLKIRQIRLSSANSDLFRKIMMFYNVDLIITATWPELISEETYNIPKIATINVHPSLLPKYRGPNPYMQTILHGEEYSGVTLHLMSDKFDNGAILKQEKIKIMPLDTSKELREKSARLTREMIRELIEDFQNKVVAPVPQNESIATYYPHISGDEKMLDFSFQTSTDISRTIRALHPFLPCYITIGEDFLIANPYNFKILPYQKDFVPGSIIDKNSKMRSVTIVCADKKPIQLNGLKLYGSKNVERFIEKKVEITQV